MKAYPLELRERVWEDYEENRKRQGKDKLTLAGLATKWKVSVEWIKKIRKQFLQTGSLAPIKPKTGPKIKLEPITIFSVTSSKRLPMPPLRKSACSFPSKSVRKPFPMR